MSIPERIPSTCAVAQALGKSIFAQHYPSADVFNNYVLLRRPHDLQATVFTVSMAFRDWIYTFDRWQKLREQVLIERINGSPRSGVKGRPPCPITILVDAEKHHISIEGEPASESHMAVLPDHLLTQYMNGFNRSRKSAYNPAARRRQGGWASAADSSKSLGKGKLSEIDSKTEKTDSFV